MKKELRLYILTLSIFITNLLFSQDYTDYLVDENNTKIFCKITQIKNGKVKYRLKGNSYFTIKTLTKFADVKFSNPDVLKNPQGLEIEKPESGYSHVYFYFSEVIYKVRHNGEKLTRIGIGRYYLHKIKAGETHTYSSTGNSLEIEAKNQQTYLIRGTFGKSYNIGNGMGVITTELVLDNRKISEYALLSMKKKAK